MESARESSYEVSWGVLWAVITKQEHKSSIFVSHCLYARNMDSVLLTPNPKRFLLCIVCCIFFILLSTVQDNNTSSLVIVFHKNDSVSLGANSKNIADIGTVGMTHAYRVAHLVMSGGVRV